MTETRSDREQRQAAWMRPVLALAAAYNLLWGAWVVAAPDAWFRLTGLTPLAYPQIWQCVGMVVGVYGVGYAIAAAQPLRHWPIVLVGLLGKILGPIGLAFAVLDGALPASWISMIVANDLVWWVPFALILRAAWRSHREGRGHAVSRRRALTPATSLALRVARSQTGESLLSLTRRQPRLVVCLRHLGCSFCRETLGELRRQRPAIEASGVGIVLVHPAADDERAAALAGRYGLADLPRIADPERVLYRSFGLEAGGVRQLFGLGIVWRALGAAFRGHRPGRPGGSPWQMPGVFLVDDKRVVAEFRYRDVAQRPDFVSLAGSSTRASAQPPELASRIAP